MHVLNLLKTALLNAPSPYAIRLCRVLNEK
nr:MAG TPA_asm: hypothetical protein [Caudoviricetes sp.]